MDQNREPEINSYVYGHLICNTGAMGKGQSVQNGDGKLDSSMRKNATGPLSYTKYKNQLKMD